VAVSSASYCSVSLRWPRSSAATWLQGGWPWSRMAWTARICRPSGAARDRHASRGEHRTRGEITALAVGYGNLVPGDTVLVERRVPTSHGMLGYEFPVAGLASWLCLKADAIMRRDKPKDACDVVWLIDALGPLSRTSSGYSPTVPPSFVRIVPPWRLFGTAGQSVGEIHQGVGLHPDNRSSSCCLSRAEASDDRCPVARYGAADCRSGPDVASSACRNSGSWKPPASA
jgi:hypothetical protein